jgi:hypothetical protein
MNRHQLSQILRITWTAFWGIAALLLLVLWVRSQHWRDEPIGTVGGHPFSITSRYGELSFDSGVGTYGRTWLYKCDPSNRIDLFTCRTNRLGFGYGHGQYGMGTTVTLPHYFVVLLTATSAAAPWLPWRFSLRTLLIAMTLIAVGMGLIMWAMG